MPGSRRICTGEPPGRGAEEGPRRKANNYSLPGTLNAISLFG